MPEAFQAEFTGERVIPGRVEDNLFNEHFARYRFAARLAQDLRLDGAFLDAGCGAGYGSVELAKNGAQVLGIDVSSEAIAHASSNYGGSANPHFELASCTAIPARDATFRLITAFEVIEHLSNWRDLLAEARRVLDPGGVFLVSTPNRLYYAESRQKAGPNPFHVHEFTEQEFRDELAPFFPHVKMLLQNHIEGIALSGADTDGAALEISTRRDDPNSAHFFLAVCSLQEIPSINGFVFIPETGNVLQTRERHIALLDGEILKKNQWIEVEKTERRRMIEKVRSLEGELDEHSRWATQANEEAERRAALVVELQAELLKSNEWAQSRDAEAVKRGQRVEQLQEEVEQATVWARSRDVEAEERGQRVVELQEELEREQESGRAAIDATEQWRRDKEAADRWALDIESRLSAERDAAREAFDNAEVQIAAMRAEMDQLRDSLGIARQRLDMIAQSRWVRLGRVVRVGPEIART